MKRRRQIFWALCFAALAFLLVAPFIGQVSVPLSAIWGGGSAVAQEVFWKLRVPRVCLSFLAGAALAVSGLVFQAVFRNVLADPFTLGVASGAAFGASLAYRLGLTFGFGLVWLGGSTLMSFLGALLTMLLVVVLASPARGFTASSMLLAGVIIGFFFSSLILLLQYLSDVAQVYRLARWLMGSLDVVGFEQVWLMGALIAVGFVAVFILGRELDLLTLGDDLALSRGADVKRARFVLFVATSLMVAAVVSICGPIGFVGLVIPYVCRTLLQVGHRELALASACLGGAFLTLCDTLARVVVAPAEMPVGVVTAIIGGPFFLWVLGRSRV